MRARVCSTQVAARADTLLNSLNVGTSVSGLDTSAPFVELARARAKAMAPEVSFSIGNILELTTHVTYDAILCRGVLNDLVDDTARQKAFISFAGALRRSGVLILDVRDWETSAAKKSHEPVVENEVETPKGRLNFRSETRLDEAAHQLLVRESHVLKTEGREIASAFEFRMRCWTANELTRELSEAGFEAIEFCGAYEVGAEVGSSDRIVCVSQLS